VRNKVLIRRVIFGFVWVASALIAIVSIASVSFLHSSYKSSAQSQVTLLSTGTKSELRYPDCQIGPPELWTNSVSKNRVWQRIQNVQLTTFYNCLGMPVRLYVSKDEKLLFVRRAADRELMTSLAPSARKSSWSDLIDISNTAPKTVLSLIECCMRETDQLEQETNMAIDKISKTSGIELLPY
jgi:hypothetical protein